MPPDRKKTTYQMFIVNKKQIIMHVLDVIIVEKKPRFEIACGTKYNQRRPICWQILFAQL